MGADLALVEASVKKATWEFQLPEYSAIISFIDSILSEINMGLLVYHAENPDEVASYRLIYANREASRCTGTDLGNVLGLTIFEAFPELGETKVPDLFYEVVKKHEARRMGIVRYADPNVEKGAYDVKAFPMPQNCFGVLFENLSNPPA